MTQHRPAPSTPRARIIAVGNELRGDDGAALEAARRLRQEHAPRDGTVQVLIAGQSGPELLDLLLPNVPTVLMDAVRLRSANPGQVVEMRLEQVPSRASELWPTSTHGLGVAEVLRLGRSLGRPLPPGLFVGIVGERFDPESGLSPAVAEALSDYLVAVRTASQTLAAQPRPGVPSSRTET
jgi:hydrogenase maturation protease